MRRFLNSVGLTGIDDYTDLKFLQEIYQRYPFVEFGVCYDLPDNASIKYAGYRIGNKLIKMPELPWVAHLSEQNVDHYLSYSSLDYLKGIKWKRIQLNINFSTITYPQHILELFEKIEFTAHKLEYKGTFIISENPAIRSFIKKTRIPDYIDILNDVSGGKGLTPTTKTPWVLPYHSRFGFAGGIAPHNIDTTLQQLKKKIIQQYNYLWIDMESSLKCSLTGTFDPTKAMIIAQQAQAYTFQTS